MYFFLAYYLKQILLKWIYWVFVFFLSSLFTVNVEVAWIWPPSNFPFLTILTYCHSFLYLLHKSSNLWTEKQFKRIFWLAKGLSILFCLLADTVHTGFWWLSFLRFFCIRFVSTFLDLKILLSDYDCVVLISGRAFSSVGRPYNAI